MDMVIECGLMIISDGSKKRQKSKGIPAIQTKDTFQLKFQVLGPYCLDRWLRAKQGHVRLKGDLGVIG